MSRVVCKKCLILFLFLHRTYVLDICKNRLSEAILKHIQNICFFKVLIQYSCIICDYLLPLKQKFRDSHCHYNEFSRCIECRYKKGCLYLFS